MYQHIRRGDVIWTRILSLEPTQEVVLVGDIRHTLFRSRRWCKIWTTLEAKIGEMRADNIMMKLSSSKDSWKAVTNVDKMITKSKNEDLDVIKIPITFALVAAAAAQLNNEYLPPNAGGGGRCRCWCSQLWVLPSPLPLKWPSAAPAPEVSYAAPAAAPAADLAYSAPAASYEASYESEAAEPAHSFSQDDGYPAQSYSAPAPAAQSYSAPAPAAQFLLPAQSYSAPAAQSYSAPAPAAQSYSAPAAQSYSAPAPAAQSYSAPAQAAADSGASASFSDADGYRYKTHRRVVYRRNRF
ncbi:uncharacterized protein LOC131997636 [Stomoxys calcitrans]|uniref:uncharacterized protein LOC131997636 n=1 Tax=Stomoxys calcitrans TaxID=35570 RepID=UPI0027E39334|nr:uncharacterized protein LOC131997636 [Stomoxys calcitrans]